MICLKIVAKYMIFVNVGVGADRYYEIISLHFFKYYSN